MVEIDDVHGFHVYLALGGAESVLLVQRLRESNDGCWDEWISVGDSNRSGLTAYFLLGKHHTELPDYYRIPTSQALEAVRELFETGERPSSITWDTNSF
jgi:hypothetical protein